MFILASNLMAQVYPLLSNLWLISLISHFSLSISALNPCTVTGVSGYKSGRPMANVMSNFAIPRMSFLKAVRAPDAAPASLANRLRRVLILSPSVLILRVALMVLVVVLFLMSLPVFLSFLGFL